MDPPIHTEYFLSRSNIFNPLLGTTSVFDTLSFGANRTDKDSENNCAVANHIYLVNQVLQLIHGHNSVTTVPLTRSDFATVATAAVAANCLAWPPVGFNDVFC